MVDAGLVMCVTVPLARGGKGSGGLHRWCWSGWARRGLPSPKGGYLVCRLGAEGRGGAWRACDGGDDRASHGGVAESPWPGRDDSPPRQPDRDMRVPGRRGGVRPRLCRALRRSWPLRLSPTGARPRLGGAAARSGRRDPLRRPCSRHRTARSRRAGEGGRLGRRRADDRVRGRRLLRRCDELVHRRLRRSFHLLSISLADLDRGIAAGIEGGRSTGFIGAGSPAKCTALRR